MPSPERPAAPDIIAGRRVRRVDLDVGGACVFILEAADADEVLEETVAGAGDPYAAILWPTAYAAALRLATLARPGLRVLDVGAGTGLVALAAAALGCRATALDHDPFAREVIAHAASLQALDVAVADFDVQSRESLPAADLVVMADLLYEPVLARAAGARAREAIDAGARVLIGDPGRYGRAELLDTLAGLGLAPSFDDVVVRLPGEAMPARVGIALLG